MIPPRKRSGFQVKADTISRLIRLETIRVLPQVGQGYPVKVLKTQGKSGSRFKIYRIYINKVPVQVTIK
jgi:hypothetical protein